MNGTFWTANNIIFIIVAMIPSIIAWIRLGPRVDALEKDRDEQAEASRAASVKRDADDRVTQGCLVRLTTLQEVAERRLERLEDKRN